MVPQGKHRPQSHIVLPKYRSFRAGNLWGSHAFVDGAQYNMESAMIRYGMIAALGAAMLTSGCVSDNHADRRSDHRYRDYDYNRPDPAYGGYDAGRYYRDHRRYRERRLSSNDRVYRGGDGRYYCRHDDGTTGLIVGGIAGGVLGNVIAPGGSETLGTILGAAGGAIAGRAIDKSDGKDVRCR
jgi:hypothetical protein